MARAARTPILVATSVLLVLGCRLLTVGAQSAPLDPAAQLEFLRNAKVISSKPIGKGITGALRVTLSDGTLTHDASFQAVDEKSSLQDIAQGRMRAGERRFVDSYRYNIAAYELAALLGLGHMMPPTIERTINGRPGALSWWIDDVLMDEEEREKKGLQSPSAMRLNHGRQRMFVFAELVYDTDRNKGNVLYTTDWDVKMIDFSRAFRLHETLRAPKGLEIIDRRLLAALKALTPESLKEATGEWLTDQEQRALLKRRDLIVERFETLIRERGEGRVVY